MLTIDTNRPIVTQAQWDEEFEYASGKELRKTRRTNREVVRKTGKQRGDKTLIRKYRKVVRSERRATRKARLQALISQFASKWKSKYGKSARQIKKSDRKAKRQLRKLDPVSDPNSDRMEFQFDLPRLTTKPATPLATGVTQPTIVPSTMYKVGEGGSYGISEDDQLKVTNPGTGETFVVDKKDVGNKEVVFDENQPVVTFNEEEVELVVDGAGVETFVPNIDVSEETGVEEEGGWKSLSKGKKTAIILVGALALAFTGYAIYKAVKR